MPSAAAVRRAGRRRFQGPVASLGRFC